jgi:hypothetical protein
MSVAAMSWLVPAMVAENLYAVSLRATAVAVFLAVARALVIVQAVPAVKVALATV